MVDLFEIVVDECGHRHVEVVVPVGSLELPPPLGDVSVLGKLPGDLVERVPCTEQVLVSEDRDPGEAVVVVELLDRPPRVLDPSEREAVAAHGDRLTICHPEAERQRVDVAIAEVVEGVGVAVGQCGGEVIGEQALEVVRFAESGERVGEPTGDHGRADHRVSVRLGRPPIGKLAGVVGESGSTCSMSAISPLGGWHRFVVTQRSTITLP